MGVADFDHLSIDGAAYTGTIEELMDAYLQITYEQASTERYFSPRTSYRSSLHQDVF